MAVVLALPGSYAWWRARFYGGWPGPQGILRQIILVDGQSADALVHLEMFLVLTAVLFLFVFWALSRTSVSFLRVVSLAGVALLFVPALLLAGEALYIGLLAGPSTIAEYHFGSESMVAHGGWAYRSRLNYVMHGLLWSAALGIPAVILAASARRARRQAAA